MESIVELWESFACKGSHLSSSSSVSTQKSLHDGSGETATNRNPAERVNKLSTFVPPEGKAGELLSAISNPLSASENSSSSSSSSNSSIAGGGKEAKPRVF